MVRLVLVGPPGAGKGTQAAVLSEQLGVPHISTGDLFRANIGNATPLGQKAKSYMDAGELVPDEVTNEMVRDRLTDEDAAKGFLLDGYPRNAAQAEVLGEMLEDQSVELTAVLQFDVPEEELVKRMLARGRSDDTEDVIRRRLAVYHSETEPLLEYYRDKIIKIDAVGSIDEISARALEALRTRA
ncbi:adenylate kinase [Saccharopolyspora sp. K220]|uniref:adenylate kinase n=1 Tax=Saccharopolyspora soli TaxID=2926618 RepID=UPI001F5865BA|nr:adenylate kinase [Saccharopolyspora soli]MCI2417146.1 adenylate kinase [Saccharopolyspora soli]